MAQRSPHDGRLRAASLAAVLVGAALLGGCGSSTPARRAHAATAPGATSTPAARSLAGVSSRPEPRDPNIVFVLTDDLAWNLVRYMPHVLRMEREG